jgi:hypothetical protein
LLGIEEGDLAKLPEQPLDTGAAGLRNVHEKDQGVFQSEEGHCA